MMRSMYSGVAGLKVHQTKMDVIGNNIANVNTVGFKSSNVNFSDVLYQTTQNASGASEEIGLTGRNAKQIGIGSQVASITTTVATTGGSQRTDNALDCMISGDAFFIVNQGGTNYFTKAGSFNVDSLGTLCTASGAAVMGWQVNSDGTDINRDTVSKLNVMSAEHMSTPPEATTEAYVTGNVDESDTQLGNDGVAMQVNFFDKLGNSYNLKLAMKETTETAKYSITVTDIVGSDGKSILTESKVPDTGGDPVLTAKTNMTFTFGGVTYTPTVENNELVLTATGTATIAFDPATGKFEAVTAAGATGTTGTTGTTDEETKKLTLTFTSGNAGGNTTTGDETAKFEDLNVDFSTITQYAGSGKCNLESQRGTVDGTGRGAGRTMGEMIGLSVDDSGKIYGSYDNGTSKLLGQIAVTTFANATGLEAVGDSLFAITQNSGDFDGIGKDITETGGSLLTGVLEMSNVDLANEFTQMITTQRGFQANSRIITTSDSMLEELVNLKR